MQRFLSLILVIASSIGTGHAAQREWQTGTWSKPAATPRPVTPRKDYAIETETLRLDVRETASPAQPPLTPVMNTPVAFAIEGNIVYVRQGDAERALTLIKRTEKPKTYSATGGGHFVKTVADEGLTVTLEDGSIWQIDPAEQHRTAHWQPLAGITVISGAGRSTTAFDYVLTNTDEDEGAPAKVIRVP